MESFTAPTEATSVMTSPLTRCSRIWFSRSISVGPSAVETSATSCR